MPKPLLLLALFFSILFGGCSQKPTKNKNTLKNTLSSICLISTMTDGTQGKSSTGLLIDPEYILSVSHGIHVDVSDPTDTVWNVKFFGPEKEVLGTVIFATTFEEIESGYDVALIKLSEPINRHIIPFSEKEPKLTDKLTHIGCLNGLPPLITDGYQGYFFSEHLDRSSISSYPGGSGGPVLNSNYELVGIVYGVGMSREFEFIKIPIIDGENVLTAVIPNNKTDLLPHDTIYVRITSIKDFLTDVSYFDPIEPIVVDHQLEITRLYVNLVMLLGVFFIALMILWQYMLTQRRCRRRI